jgi:hypothetical protein
MLHLPSINRPILKTKGPINSIEEHQKEPYKSVKEYQTDEDIAVRCRSNHHKHPYNQRN